MQPVMDIGVAFTLKIYNIMSVDEFNTFVGELINDIKDYQEAIACLK